MANWGAVAPKTNKQKTVTMKEIVCLDMTLYSTVITKALEEDIASIFQVKLYLCVNTHRQ